MRIRTGRYLVAEAINGAECLHICHSVKEVEDSIKEFVELFGCKPSDLVVLPLSAAIPFKTVQVEKITLNIKENGK